MSEQAATAVADVAPDEVLAGDEVLVEEELLVEEVSIDGMCGVY
jgi:mycofactocin precursor